MSALEKIVYPAWIAEVQAIAIYEAEVFWCRSDVLKVELNRILNEERSHAGQMREWLSDRPWARRWNRMAGWVLGSILIAIPEPYFSRVQAWAETQASEIYETAASHAVTVRSIHPHLLAVLKHASEQEREHAQFFSERLRSISGMK